MAPVKKVGEIDKERQREKEGRNERLADAIFHAERKQNVESSC